VQVLDRDSGKYSFTVSSYMLELYQDELTDLLLPVPAKQGIQKVTPTPPPRTHTQPPTHPFLASRDLGICHLLCRGIRAIAVKHFTWIHSIVAGEYLQWSTFQQFTLSFLCSIQYT